MFKHKANTIILIAFFLTSVLLVLYLSKHGVGDSPDSILYLGIAHNMVTTNSATIPFGIWAHELVTHYPPGYPALIALFSLIFHTTVFTSARILNAMLFGILSVLTISCIQKIKPQEKRVSYVAGCILLTSIPLLSFFITASSEGIMMVSGLIAGIAAYQYVTRKNILYLLLCMGSIWIATLTRYAGIAYLISISIYLLFFPKHTLKTRIISLLGITISSIPILLWTIKTIEVNGRILDRVILYHPTSIGTILRDIVSGIGAWSNSPNYLLLIGIVLGLISVTAYIKYVYHTKNQPSIRRHCMPLIGLFFLIYITTLIVTRVTIDAAIFSDPTRMLIPLLVPCIIFLSGVVDTKKIHSIILIRYALLYFLIIYISLFTTWATTIKKQGIGFASPTWQAAPIFPIVLRIDNQKILYSNSPHLLFVYTNRYARELPITYSMTSTERNTDYENELKNMLNSLSQDKGYIVYFRGVSGKRLASEVELKAIKGVYIVAETEKALIFGYNKDL